MGKGDKRTKRGKLWKGSRGKTHRITKNAPAAKPTAKK
jgi:ribosomal small subunit protein bTHX